MPVTGDRVVAAKHLAGLEMEPSVFHDSTWSLMTPLATKWSVAVSDLTEDEQLKYSKMRLLLFS